MERRVRLLSELVGLAMTLYVGWTMLPVGQRRTLLMKVSDQLRARSQRLAAASGRYAMRRELSGDADAAELGYDTAYHLMTRLHDRAADWYERLRGA